MIAPDGSGASAAACGGARLLRSAAMQTIKRLWAGNPHDRIDETSTKWKQRAGRADGPDTYVPGDLVRSLFGYAMRMSHHERDGIYGGSVILVGVAEARGIALPEGSKLPW